MSGSIKASSWNDGLRLVTIPHMFYQFLSFPHTRIGYRSTMGLLTQELINIHWAFGPPYLWSLWTTLSQFT